MVSYTTGACLTEFDDWPRIFVRYCRSSYDACLCFTASNTSTPAYRHLSDLRHQLCTPLLDLFSLVLTPVFWLRCHSTSAQPKVTVPLWPFTLKCILPTSEAKNKTKQNNNKKGKLSFFFYHVLTKSLQLQTVGLTPYLFG